VYLSFPRVVKVKNEIEKFGLCPRWHSKISPPTTRTRRSVPGSAGASSSLALQKEGSRLVCLRRRPLQAAAESETLRLRSVARRGCASGSTPVLEWEEGVKCLRDRKTLSTQKAASIDVGVWGGLRSVVSSRIRL
jgi:hypothetical protein